ncbi:hypothetical protein G9A89_006909 [Geosiphon pyriformis]|nr:hypothetical protein G9A89_006909 [Geosiphon pyriformis]
MNLVKTHGAYATNNPKKTWASNGVQRRLNYVFTDAVTASMITNIGVVDVNESFSTDHKAVVTMFQSDRILAGTKKSRSGRKKSSTTLIDVKKASGAQWEIYARETDRLTDEAQRKSVNNCNDDLNQMWFTIKRTVLQAAECQPKRKVEARFAHTKKECMDHKLVKIDTDIIKHIRVNNADMHDNNVMQMLQQQRQIVDNIIKRQQNFELNKGAMIKSILNRKRQKIVLDHVIEKGKFHDDPNEIKKLLKIGLEQEFLNLSYEKVGKTGLSQLRASQTMPLMV